MTIELWLIICLFISVGVNAVLIWFSKEQSKQLLYVSQNLGDLVELLASYREHMNKVYSLEMFYGDETLQSLMEHTNAIVFLLQKEYSEITQITDPLEVTFEKEEPDAQKEEQKEQDVFYGGSRTSDT